MEDKYLEYLRMRKRLIQEKYEKEQLKKELQEYYRQQNRLNLTDDKHNLLKTPNHFTRYKQTWIK